MHRDLESLSRAELQAMMADIRELLQKRNPTDLSALRAAANASLKAGGYSLEKVDAAPSKHKAKRKRQAYADPFDLSLSWSGCGRMPGWLKERIAAGAKLEDFAVQDGGW